MPIANYSPYTPVPPNNPGNTKSTHHIVVRVNGQVVGRIQSLAPRQNRPVTKIFELNRWSTGRAVDQIPGVVETDQIDITGMELWTNTLEQALGASGAPLSHLADQTDPFNIDEVWYYPDGSMRTRTYYGCFLSDINPEAMTGDGNKVYRKTATVHVLGRMDS